MVHCAFSHLPGRYRGGEGDDVVAFWETNLGGTVRLLEAARQAGVTRAVCLSSRAVFGAKPLSDQPLTDDQPTSPDTHYGALKVATEALAKSYGPGFSVTCLRPTGVYGLTYPVWHSKWWNLVEGLFSRHPFSERVATEVHGLDVARAVHLLLTSRPDQVAGKTFNCSDLVVSHEEVVARLRRARGEKVTLPPSPGLVSNQMGCPGLNALGWQPGGETLLEETLSQLLRTYQEG